jgi:transcriptional regulator with XRE-family HTH domain
MAARTSTLGTAIRLRRQEIGLTQEQLAERIGDGVRQSDVSRLERDRIQLPRPSRFRAIAAALDLEPGELLHRSGWESIALETPDGDAPSAAIDQRPQERPPDDEADTATIRLNRALDEARTVQMRFLSVAKLYDQTVEHWKRHFGIAPE